MPTDPEVEYWNEEKQEWRTSDGLSWDEALFVNTFVGWEMYRKVE